MSGSKFVSRFAKKVRSAAAARAVCEPLEDRSLFAVFAPASIADGSIAATITTGTAPLQTSGSYVIQPTNHSTVTLVPDSGPTVSAAYTYSRTGVDVGDFRYVDPNSGVVYDDVLTFTSLTGGSFSLAAFPGGPVAQTGTFAFTAAAKVPGPDLTLGFLVTPTVSAVSGDQGTAVVALGNFGTVTAVGFVTINLYVSPDGTVAHGTPLAHSTSLQGVLANGFRAIAVPFTYPTVTNGQYYFVATVTPSSILIDTDQSDNTAVSATAIQVSPQLIDLSASNLSLTNAPAGGYVTGSRGSAVVTITNDGNRPVVGLGRVNLFAAPSPAGPDVAVVPTPTPAFMRLAPGQSMGVKVNFIAPSVGDTAQLQFFVATLDSSAATHEGDIVGGVDLNNIVSTVNPILVSPSTVTLVPQVVSSLPQSVLGGTLAVAVVRVTNTGNVIFRGDVPVGLYASSQITPVDPFAPVALGQKALVLPAGGSQMFRVAFNYPTILPTANYFLLAQTGPSATEVDTAIGIVPINVAPSAFAASASQVNIIQPLVTLNAQFAALPATSFAGGALVTLNLSLLNSGNVTAKGIYTVQVFATTTGDPNDGGAVALTPAIRRGVAIAANAQASTVVRFRMPAGVLTPGVNYSFIARFVAVSIPDITDPNFAAVSGQMFVVTG